MRILLDENMPSKVEYDFGEGHDVRTVRKCGGWARRTENYWVLQRATALS